MTDIAFTKVSLPHGWLGNMAPFPISYNGKIWRTSEALFQAMRFNKEEIIEAIRAEKSPMAAKFVAKKYKLEMIVVPGSPEDIQNMKICVALKLSQHNELAAALLATEDSMIYEDVTARGSSGNNLVWGAMKVNNEWIGENKLGQIWIDLRSAIKEH